MRPGHMQETYWNQDILELISSESLAALRINSDLPATNTLACNADDTWTIKIR